MVKCNYCNKKAKNIEVNNLGSIAICVKRKCRDRYDEERNNQSEMFFLKNGLSS